MGALFTKGIDAVPNFAYIKPYIRPGLEKRSGGRPPLPLSVSEISSTAAPEFWLLLV